MTITPMPSLANLFGLSPVESAPSERIDPFTTDPGENRALSMLDLTLIYHIRQADTNSPQFLSMLVHLAHSRTGVSDDLLARMPAHDFFTLYARVAAVAILKEKELARHVNAYKALLDDDDDKEPQ